MSGGAFVGERFPEVVAPSFNSENFGMSGHDSQGKLPHISDPYSFEDFSPPQISTPLATTRQYDNHRFDPLSWPNTDLPNDLQSFQSTSTNLDFDMESPIFETQVDSKPTCQHQPPRWMKDYFAGTLALPSKPTSVEEAMHSKQWYTAMNDEMDSIHQNGTWILESLPRGRQPLSTRWVFKAKQNAEGKVIKCKARLVVRGCEQRQGLDYEETFALVVKWGTLRGLAALVAKHRYPIYHLDVKTAFLHGHIKEENHVLQPLGFAVKGQEHFVRKLFKALYGLRQSPRAWYERIDSFLIQQGFTRGTGDSNLYRYCLAHDIVLLALYVDDILLTGSSSQPCSSIKSLLRQILK